MSLITNIKKAFGLTPDDSDYAESEYEVNVSTDAPAHLAADAAPEQADEPDHAMVNMIFATVVDAFDQALPGFISGAVDPEKQRAMLYGMLDDSVKAYLASLATGAEAKCQSLWEQERQKLVGEADQLRQRAQELENRKQEIKDKQLSAERQKRALNERVRDLEAQVLQLEAEKEQYEIENKCMANKIKVAGVLGREEINDAMRDDFKKRAAEATQALKELQDKHAALEAEMQVKEAVIADLNKQLEEAKAIISENSLSQEEIEALQKQMEQFESVKKRLDQRYEKQRESLKASQAECDSLRETIKHNLLQSAQTEKELRAQIQKLEEDLEALNSSASAQHPAVQPDIAAEAEVAYEKAEKRGRKHKNPDQLPQDVDDLMEGSDWLVATPAEDKSMRMSGEDDDFGYQPPQRRPRQIDADAQPSLFDFD